MHLPQMRSEEVDAAGDNLAEWGVTHHDRPGSESTPVRDGDDAGSIARAGGLPEASPNMRRREETAMLGIAAQFQLPTSKNLAKLARSSV